MRTASREFLPDARAHEDHVFGLSDIAQAGARWYVSADRPGYRTTSRFDPL